MRCRPSPCGRRPIHGLWPSCGRSGRRETDGRAEYFRTRMFLWSSFSASGADTADLRKPFIRTKLCRTYEALPNILWAIDPHKHWIKFPPRSTAGLLGRYRPAFPYDHGSWRCVWVCTNIPNVLVASADHSSKNPRSEQIAVSTCHRTMIRSPSVSDLPPCCLGSRRQFIHVLQKQGDCPDLLIRQRGLE